MERPQRSGGTEDKAVLPYAITTTDQKGDWVVDLEFQKTEILCRIPIRAVIVLEVEPQRADRSAWCLP